jgi:AraC-like DNA-binding protein
VRFPLPTVDFVVVEVVGDLRESVSLKGYFRIVRRDLLSTGSLRVGIVTSMRDLHSLLTFSTESDGLIKVLACGHCVGTEELIASEGRVLKDQYVIHYFTRGKGAFRDTHTSEREFEDDHVVIFYPGVRHHIGPLAGEELEHYYVLFMGELPRILLKQLEEQHVAIFPIAPNPTFRERFSAMMRCTTTLTQHSVHNANAMLYALINETIGLYEGNRRGRGESSVVSDYTTLVAQNYRLPELDLDRFLKRVQVSKKQFAARFKQEMGITPYQYWLSYKIAQAKLLLSSTDGSIKEIAYELGFQDEFYFSRLFKRKESLSPKAFRASLYR